MADKKPKEKSFPRLATGEPFFILRAQDPLAPEHVEAWAIEAELNGYPNARVTEARAIAKAMRTWRETKKPRQANKSNKARAPKSRV